MKIVKVDKKEVLHSQQTKHLTDLYALVKSLRENSKRLEKEQAIRKALSNTPQLGSYIVAAYNPYQKYHLKRNNVVKHRAARKGSKIGLPIANPLFSTLSRLSRRLVTGHAAINEWLAFTETLPYKELSDLCDDILEGDLRCGVNVKTWNKILEELGLPIIPQFEIALGMPSKNLKKERMWEHPDGCYVSRKMDGVRCLAFIHHDGDVELFSRTGKPLLNFNALRRVLYGWVSLRDKNAGPSKPIVLDGELALRTPDGSDDFQGLMKVLRKKDVQVTNAVYHVFDAIPSEDFMARVGTTMFKDRQKLVKSVHSVIDPNSEHVKVVRQVKIESHAELRKWSKKAAKRNWEGLIARIGSVYKGKRSSDIWKIKTFSEDEFKIKDYKLGDWDTVQNGKQVTLKNVVTTVKVSARGVTSWVGSGLSREERVKFAKDPKRYLLNKTATVKYFEGTKDQNGKPSLRFPTIKTIHGDKREY